MPDKEYEGYIKNRYAQACEIAQTDSGLIRSWENLYALSLVFGAASVINSRLCHEHPIKFESPEGVRIEIYNSFAGKIPVIYAQNRNDFEQLVIALSYEDRQADEDMIAQMGASFISSESTRFMILSSKPYSNVSADELGLGESEWAEKSVVIRRSHECVHFFTKQIYAIANNNLHDELMADLIGIHDAFGYYKAEWFLRFMGLIGTSGGRLRVYTNGLSEQTTEAVAEIARKAAYGLERWSESKEFAELSNAGRIKRMCALGIEGMTEL